MIGNTKFHHPDHIRIIKKVPEGWLFYPVKPFVTHTKVDDINDLVSLYGISEKQITIELFRVAVGRLGYYLADLKNKKYYYCGEESDSVRSQLLAIGIGRKDPMG